MNNYKYSDSGILLEYMFETLAVIKKGDKGEKLVKKLDALTKKTMKKIKDEILKIELEKMYEKHIKQYINNIGYDNLKLIKNGNE